MERNMNTNTKRTHAGIARTTSMKRQSGHKAIPVTLGTAALLVALTGAGISRTWAADAKPSAESLITSPERVIQCTPGWTGERMTDGRPKVSDDIVNRMKYVSITEAWGAVGNNANAYEGPEEWKILRPDEVICGRVLTAQYLPARSEYNQMILAQGAAEGRIGQYNSWPIDMLQKGDVYVADGFGKVVDGTLIGDNLGNAIYAKSGNGVIFDAGVRDMEGIEEIKGFNFWVRGVHPSAIGGMMLMGINVPIHIGRAIVFPGDIVLAKHEGMVFVPAQLAERVVTSSESTRVRDCWSHMRLWEAKYTPGQVDRGWSAEMTADYVGWLKENRTSLVDKLHVPLTLLDSIIAGGGRSGGGGGGATKGGRGGRGAGGGPAAAAAPADATAQ
jgi:4-hydroxy-4-methyl-2-oxoglutarate aldolase